MGISSLSADELLRLLDAAQAANQRDYLMMLVAFSHGLRASEVIALTRDSIADGYITVRRLKGSERTRQPLISSTNPLLDERHHLLEYIVEMHANQVVFPVCRQTFWRAVQRAGRAAGVPAHKLHPHALKHTCALQALESAKINEVQKYLGHKSLSSTGEYLKVTDEQAAARVGPALGNLKS